MKDALLKRRYGIPAALLVALLLCGTALAWYGINSISTKTTVQESLSTASKVKAFSTICPVENDNWSFYIQSRIDNAIVKWIEVNR